MFSTNEPEQKICCLSHVRTVIHLLDKPAQMRSLARAVAAHTHQIGM